LVMTEMVCVSATGRISPGCTGMYEPQHEVAWRRIVDFIHGQTRAKVGLQLGHSGRKGSTQFMWQGMDEPLPAGNWDVCGPSALRYAPWSHLPRELSQPQIEEIRRQFENAALAGARA